MGNLGKSVPFEAGKDIRHAFLSLGQYRHGEMTAARKLRRGLTANRPTQTKSIGGSRETEEKELAVNPRGAPLGSHVVTDGHAGHEPPNASRRALGLVGVIGTPSRIRAASSAFTGPRMRHGASCVRRLQR